MVMIVLHCVISTIKSLLELICIIVFVFQVLKLRSIIIIISVGGQNQNPTGFSRRSLNIIDCKRRSKSIRSSGKIDDAGVFLLSTEFTVFPLHFSSAHTSVYLDFLGHKKIKISQCLKITKNSKNFTSK